MKACVFQMPYSKDLALSDEYFEYKINMLEACEEELDLIVLPEYSEVPCVTETWEETLYYHNKYFDRLLEKCRETARRCKAMVFVNTLSPEGDVFRNTTYCYDRKGNLAGKYFKTHIPPVELRKGVDHSYTMEPQKPFLLEMEGIRFAFLTCYDFYFYEATARIALEKPDVIIGCSHQRSDTHSAIEIQCRHLAYHTSAWVLRSSVSFSEDATRYLHEIARAEGEEINTANLYIGGCSFEMHHENMLSERKVYKPQNDTELTGFISLREGIEADDWDIVTFQQQSSSSAIYGTFQPYLNELSAYVKKALPNAKQYLHQTWAYQTGSKMIYDAGFATYEEMFAPIHASYEKAFKDINADGMIRSGEAMLLLKNSGYPYIHRDCFHANSGVSRLMLACLWFTKLFGPLNEDAVMNIKTDVPVSEEERKLIIKVVNSIN